jgi:hypothetical protein
MPLRPIESLQKYREINYLGLGGAVPLINGYISTIIEVIYISIS